MATDADTPFIATVDSVFEYTARIAVDKTVASRYFGDYSTFQRVAILLRAGICGLKKDNIRRLRIMIRVYLLTNFLNIKHRMFWFTIWMMIALFYHWRVWNRIFIQFGLLEFWLIALIMNSPGWALDTFKHVCIHYQFMNLAVYLSCLSSALIWNMYQGGLITYNSTLCTHVCR